MKYLVYMVLGFLITGNSVWGNPSYHEPEHLYKDALVHFQLLNRILGAFHKALVHDRFKVVNKETVSHYLTEAQAAIENLLESEEYSLENSLEEPFHAQLDETVEDVIKEWGAHPELVPSDKGFELSAHYVTTVLALFPYVKEYNKEQIEQEFACPTSKLVRLSSSFIGNGIALFVCSLTPKNRDTVLQQFHMLDILLEVLGKEIADNHLKVSDKETVEAYVTRMREIIGWSFYVEDTSTRNYTSELWRARVETAVKSIRDSWEHHEPLTKAIEKEFLKRDLHPHITLTQPLIDSIALLVRSLGECEAAVFNLRRELTRGYFPSA